MKRKLLSFCLLMFLLINIQSVNGQSVFINEIHYDNTSTDVNEAIEIAGPGGTDLSSWSIVLYNGNGGVLYNAINLSGSIPDQQSGYGTVIETLPTNGLQNGAPDGIALVDQNGDVVQFLSYEGSFTAADGPATGLTSTDIGVSETSETLVGYSLQLAGAGSEYTDFTWQGEAVSTYGAINNGQTFQGTSLSIVINEFVFNHTGADTDEFVEILSNPDTDLSEYWLLEIEGDIFAAGTIDEVIQLGTTDANGYFTTPFVGNQFENGTVSLLLVKNFSGSAGTDLDTDDDGVFDTTPWEGIVDDIGVNDGGVDDIDYASVTLNQSFDGGIYTVGGASRIPNGTDTDATTDWVRNDYDGQGLPSFPAAVADNGEALNTPNAENEIADNVVVTVLINEIDADTEGTDVLEFIELYDGGVGNSSLDGYVVVLYNGNGDLSYNAFDLDGYTTDENGYIVLGNAAVPNVSIVFPSNGLQNGADAVALYQDDAANFPNGTVVSTTNLLDAIVYDTNDSEDAGLLVLLNAGQAQINEGELGNQTGHSLQRIPNGEGGARNTSTYIQAIPTPGVANGGVAPTEPISILEARNATEGTTVTISGVLTVSDQFNGSAYIQDATGGIAVFDATVHGDGLFNIGDSITITGTRSAYNDQVQISPVSSVVNNGLPNIAIVAVDVTLSQLADHPGELVRVLNTSFPSPGNLLFGNSNFVLTDASGSGELRIDNDISDVVGLAQPENCAEITGVVGRYYELYQLLPRMATDIPCAEEYQPSGDDLNIPKDQTLDIVTWNIEWFGDESNSPASGNPNSDQIQKDSVKAVLLSIDADIYAVEEIADDVLFAQLVSEMLGYDYVLSYATSYPNETGVKQKIGYIYKTSCILPVSTKVLLESVHPYYNGGNTSYLTDYPADADRFYASGRLPFMMTADVTINGAIQRISFINIHARANSSSDPQLRYDMRKYDVEALKDTLDLYYPNDNFILLGDYNDDVDETVADISSTVSSYVAYVNDVVNYDILTSILSDEGFRSYVFRENMIDHITVSNELSNRFIEGSARVHYEFYDSDYASTASDHFPVSTRLQLEVLELVSTSTTDIICYGNEDGTASIEVKGGITPYTYEWSDGQTAQTAINLAVGNYDVSVSDALGATVLASVTIGEPDPLVLNMIDNQVVYVGYPDAACTTLSATEITGGISDYTYKWSTGETTETIDVCPTESSIYSLTVTDANGCSVSNNVEVQVINVICDTRGRMTKIRICYKGKSKCVPIHKVDHFLQKGASLGVCNSRTKKAGVANIDDIAENELIIEASAYPNPFTEIVTLNILSEMAGELELLVYSTSGNLVHAENTTIGEGRTQVELELGLLKPGMYILKIIGIEGVNSNMRIIKE